MKLAFFLFSLLLLPLTGAVTTYTDSFNSAAPVNTVQHTYPFVGGAGVNSCQIVLTMTPGTLKAYSALMVARTVNPPLTLYLGNYVHYNPLDVVIADLENANKGLPQTVQLSGLAPGASIYIEVIIFDKTNSYGWTITVAEQAALVSKCPPIYSKPSLTNQYCVNCIGLANYGAYCSISDTTLSNNSYANMPIASGGYLAFTIPGSSSPISLQYGANQLQVEVFIQFKTYSTEIAGLVNYVISPSGRADYMITSVADTYQITINSGGNDVSVGVINHNAATANFSVQYTTQTSLNILVIVLGVLGGLLLIALIVAAFFIIRRIRNPTQIIHPQNSAASRQSLLQLNALTPEEIEVYFPSVSCRIAFAELESSSLSLNREQQPSIDRDCVICLCPIDGNELMKVTFCRHLFHAHCLVEWFKKQRNCPYCREEYSKSSTVQHYQLLLKETSKNMLAGVDLANAIIKTKIVKSAVVIQDIKDQS